MVTPIELRKKCTKTKQNNELEESVEMLGFDIDPSGGKFYILYMHTYSTWLQLAPKIKY